MIQNQRFNPVRGIIRLFGRVFASIFIDRIAAIFIGRKRARIAELYVYHWGFRTPIVRCFFNQMEVNPTFENPMFFGWAKRFISKIEDHSKSTIRKIWN